MSLLSLSPNLQAHTQGTELPHGSSAHGGLVSEGASDAKRGTKKYVYSSFRIFATSRHS